MDNTAVAQAVKAELQQSESHHRKTSEILSEIASDTRTEMSIAALSTQLGDRGFGLMLLLFALPNAIPLPIPGASAITSLPIMFFAIQLALGKQKVWLPEWLEKREIPLARLQPFLHRAIPWLQRLECVIRPRFDRVTTRGFDRLAGAIIFLLACLIAPPIPLGNLLPGIAMTVLALAIVESDGALMIAGWILAVLGVCFVLALVSGYAWLAWQGASSIL